MPVLMRLTQSMSGEVTALVVRLPGGVCERDVLQNIHGPEVVLGHRSVQLCRQEAGGQLGKGVPPFRCCRRSAVVVALLRHGGVVSVASISPEYPTVVLAGFGEVGVMAVCHVVVCVDVSTRATPL